ncbi:hypothetical protein H7100_01330, partial [Candidatus Saccharibacteria bacterium]|nr:hypothetical protein [Candidatus Saccharibacteria bacterium]
MSIAALAVAISISWGGFASAAFAADGDPAPAETTPVVEVLPNPAPAEVTAPDTSSVEAPASQEVSDAPDTEAPAATEPETSAPSTDAVDESTLVSPPVTDSSQGKTDTPKKVFVCKFVGTPDVNERLQTGQNPISVSINSIRNWDGVIPGFFADAQGRSYTLAYDEGQAEPDVSACPTPVVVCENSSALTCTPPPPV